MSEYQSDKNRRASLTGSRRDVGRMILSLPLLSSARLQGSLGYQPLTATSIFRPHVSSRTPGAITLHNDLRVKFKLRHQYPPSRIHSSLDLTISRMLFKPRKLEKAKRSYSSRDIKVQEDLQSLSRNAEGTRVGALPNISLYCCYIDPEFDDS